MGAPGGRLGAVVDVLPEVIAERCVHARFELASCRDCADACPRRAWVVDDERLGIDAARCDGCGLCAPACPEGAVLDRWHPVRCRVDGELLAFAACSESGAPAGSGLMPCLHVLGIHRLLGLHRDGVRRLILTRGDCGDCPRGAVTRVDTSLAQVALLLRDRGLPSLELTWLDPAAWSRSLIAARARHRPPGVDRRAFFRRAVELAAEGAAELASRDGQGAPDFVPPGRLVPRTGTGPLALYAPRIDERHCTGCHACAQLCPHDAIRLQSDGYQLDPDGCTGCRICADACADAAVTVERLSPSPQGLVPLTKRRCRACGADFHLPAAKAASDLCPVCTHTGHHRRLFQVLD
ncbi:MAG: 4Fe-4S binding protein [Chromatiaceae bacterium]|jgi:Pyruvate/2-oxoacid:ferredoxin oxidoreductase delta subunit|nr:4Fe-4S binding protein [Chromatiaceae bacterium]